MVDETRVVAFDGGCDEGGSFSVTVVIVLTILVVLLLMID